MSHSSRKTSHRGLSAGGSGTTVGGSALIIVLVMVVLLTILMVAYLLNSSADRRLSNSSLNQTIADQLAHSASDIIIGDLKEEIANPTYSTITTVGPSGATSTVSFPKQSTANNYSGMLPMTNTAATTASTNPIANLVRISVRSDPIATPGVGSRASAASSSTASLNSRSVSPKRWNAHFLVPLQTAGSTTVSSTVPDSTPVSNFPVPDWVFVTGNGPQVITTANMLSSGVIGRYAFAIYDEGGLLDVNVAGTPTNSSSAPVSTGTLTSAQSSNKSSLALIDLTNLLDGSGNQLITAAAENALVGWRNSASLQANFQSGSTDAITATSTYNYFPAGFVFSANNANDFFFNFGRGSSYAYLKANYLSTGSNNLTDQTFITRQQLISMQYALQQTVGFSPSALQYLTTYSRSLDQPSYAPNPDPTLLRPITASYSSGTDPATVSASNTQGTLPATVYANSANGQDNSINPSFLAVRASSTATAGRNDGSDITIGDPLVKKRFALNRLAWITYEGPLSDGSNVGTATTAAQVNSGNSDLQKIAGYLHNNYGLSYAFLSKGTASNIYKYFGLSWVTDNRTTPLGNGQNKWLYNHSNSNSTGVFTTLPSSGGAISLLSSLAGMSTPREPDFFELLKAGIVAGSKGRNATLRSGGTVGGGITVALGSPDDYQNRIDSSLDFQIIQIGANIIAQSRLDGYSPQILYNDGTTSPSNSSNTTVPTREFSGVENLPYFYGFHAGTVQGKVPTITNLPYLAAAGLSTTTPAQYYYSKPTNPANVPAITDPGFFVLLEFPVIWNAHDQNNPRCATDSTGAPLKDSSGNPLFPTSFRIVADSIDPDDINSSGTGYSQVGFAAFNGVTTSSTSVKSGNRYIQVTLSAPPAVSPWTAATVTAQNTTGNDPPTFVMTAESTAMTFTINETATAAAQTFFREPTELISPNVPVGSNLAQGGSTNYLNYANQSSSSTVPPFTSYPSLKSFMDSNNDGGIVTTDANSSAYLNLSPALGFFLGTFLGAWNEYYKQISGVYWSYLPLLPTGTAVNKFPAITYRMQYETTPGSGNWVTYDSKFAFGDNGANVSYSSASSGLTSSYPTTSGAPSFTFALGNWTTSYWGTEAYDPRTSRFAMPNSNGTQNDPTFPTSRDTSFYSNLPWTSCYGWLNFATRNLNNEIFTQRPDYAAGYWMGYAGSVAPYGPQMPLAQGWSPVLSYNGIGATFGLLSQNNPVYTAANLRPTTQNLGSSYEPMGDWGAGFAAQYYRDPDGVVRRAMGAYWPQGDTGATGIQPATGSSPPAAPPAVTPGTVPGLPMATASSIDSTGQLNIASSQVQSRPIILHRPFRSVAELGYVFSGTPWKNLDFFTPESGDCPLLDVFCIDDSDNPDGIVAGKVNLNTRQQPVLQTILTGAYKDEEASYAGNYNPSTSTYSSGITPLSPLTGATSSTEANLIAKALLARTSGSGGTGPAWGPLVNLSDLVGRYTGTANPYTTIDNQPYDGFSADLNSSVFKANQTQSAQIQRFREAPIRALSAVGQTRVWNLLIDVIAQKGNFPANASTLDNFYVQGEQRYWVHVAIDRLTGQVIDKQIEVVQQ